MTSGININKPSHARSSSETRLKTLLETADDGIVTTNHQGIIETINPAFVNIFGYSSEEIIGQNVRLLTPDCITSKASSNVHPFVTKGARKIIGRGNEIIGQRKDGSTFPMAIAFNEMDIDGERKFTGILRNIEQCKQTETAILARGQRISTLVDTIIDGIIVIDDKGRIDTMNPAAETMFGYRISEVKSQSLKMLMPEPYASAHDRYLHKYLVTAKSDLIGTRIEIIGKRKNNSSFDMELAISEMDVNDERLFTIIVRDISARKATELELAEKNTGIAATAAFDRTQSESMALFSSSFNANLIFTEILGLLAENHGFAVSVVYLFDEQDGVLKYETSQGLPEGFKHEIPVGSGVIGQVAHTGKSILLTHGENMPFHIDTSLFGVEPVAMIVSPIIYGSKVLGTLALANTESTAKNELGFIERLSNQMGVSLSSLNQYHNMKVLSEQLKERGEEISQKNNLLEKANQLKTEFLANMSHELRTPLNAIIGFSEILRDQMQGSLNEVQADYTNEIFDSANHLLSLINDILDLSKIEAGKMELFLEPINLSALLHNCLSVVKEQAHANKINLNLTMDEGLDGLLADSRKLKQIIFNLLSNAVKFTPNGGRVNIDVTRIDNNFQVKVTDTGIGISAEKIDLLFSPFEQVDGSLSRQYEGTGLGLAMVKRLVELHGGKVNLTSTVDEGSCVCFTIPYRSSIEKKLASADVQEKHPAAQATQNHLSTKKAKTPLGQALILIVEDDDNAANLMNIQLTEAGYATQHARNADEALNLAKTLLPDLIVMDILMPGVDGWQTMQRLNQDPELHAIPVVVVTIAPDLQKGIELGAMDVFEKPLPKQVLLESINKAIPQPRDTPAKILVVDDEKKAVQFMLANINAAGYQGIEAFGGQQAIDLTHSERPDLIILDLMMPEVTGFDVVLNLRADESTHDIPIIILTAKILTDDDHKLLRNSVQAIGAKHDFDSKLFLKDVQAILSKPITSFIQVEKNEEMEGYREV